MKECRNIFPNTDQKMPKKEDDLGNDGMTV
jgi:hypothetical protein